jgi:MoaA/NifB/PqqE/SkfB family radical SAM enzyme
MLDCPHQPPVSEDWVTGFRARAAEQRIPVTATLELTSRCNLRCQHCYLGNQTEQHRKRALERDTAAVKASLDEWAEAGVLYLTITGGDPMMRRDFSEIYRHARECGMLVTVFCDGILVTDAIIALFEELPPRKVEISIYGATAQTYETVTRVPGSHARAWAGIHRLHDAGVTLGLKTVLMTLNQHELDAMQAQATELGADFRYDAAIFPCLPDHSDEPLDLRVKPEVAVAFDVKDEARRAQWRHRLERTQKVPDSDALYTCGAGQSSFFADPFGGLSPCLLTTQYRCDGGGKSFRELWEGELGALRHKRKTRHDNAFTGCLRGACSHCPAMNFLETGDEETESPYMREIAERRYTAVMSDQERPIE